MNMFNEHAILCVFSTHFPFNWISYCRIIWENFSYTHSTPICLFIRVIPNSYAIIFFVTYCDSALSIETMKTDLLNWKSNWKPKRFFLRKIRFFGISILTWVYRPEKFFWPFFILFIWLFHLIKPVTFHRCMDHEIISKNAVTSLKNVIGRQPWNLIMRILNRVLCLKFLLYDRN